MNERIGEFITRVVGTMWTAYLFAGLGVVAMYGAFTSNLALTLIAGSISGYFLQLVLLPIIIVGQNAASRSVELKIDETHTASLAEFELAKTARAAHAEEIADLKQIATALHVKLAAAEGPWHD